MEDTANMFMLLCYLMVQRASTLTALSEFWLPKTLCMNIKIKSIKIGRIHKIGASLFKHPSEANTSHHQASEFP